jgi:Ca2+-binding EF-hand superfamily protein
MYKHANKVIEHKTKFMKNMSARHTIASSRLKKNVSKIGRTVNCQVTPSHEEIMLPSLMDDQEEEKPRVFALSRSRNTVRRTASFGLEEGALAAALRAGGEHSNGRESGVSKQKSAPRVLNHEKLLSTMNKVITAESDSVPEWERRMSNTGGNVSKGKKNSKTSQISFLLLERKLVHAIKSLHKEVDSDVKGERLTSRMLLPYYKLADLKNFLQIFQSVDEDYSGDLDVEEWIKKFHAMNKSVSQQQARMMFNRVDKNGDGFLSVSDLVPVIFSNANPEQKILILKFLELELSKRKLVGNDFTTDEELEMLFEHYDVDMVGFLKISLIREKVKSFALPDAAHIALMSLLSDLEEDEMLNFSEFRRLFQNYLSIV